MSRVLKKGILKRLEIPYLRGLLLLATCFLLLVSCARMGNPDGGWYDETPPRVIGSSPSDRATEVKSGKVKIYFDEYIKIENASEKVVVSPPQIEQPEIKASGKSIVVELKDSLKSNTTYTIDFSDAISDNNEGNPLGNYTFSFSTGGEIDTMEVSGYVLEAENLEPVKGIAVGLYSADAPDSVFHTEPLLRISRTDGSGHFVVKGIAPGTYRAFALQDGDGTYTFNQKSEKIAFNRDIFVPSSKPDTRMDTIWQDTIHIDRIVPIPYTHFYPDDIVLRAFQEPQTDRVLLKTERKEANRFSLFFSYPHDSLPLIKGLNFDAGDALVVERSVGRWQASGSGKSGKSGADDISQYTDTITYWLRDSLLINQDTLQMEVEYYSTDTLGSMILKRDTLDVLSKVPYAKRLKQEQKVFEDWKKEQEKLKKRGERYDSVMPLAPLAIDLGVPSKLDPDKNLTLSSLTPFAVVDTTKIHLYTKRDSSWYAARFVVKEENVLRYRILGEWRPGQEYSLELDSAATTDIYGRSNVAVKKGFGVKGNDEFSTVLVTLTGMQGEPVVVQLLSGSDAVVKEAITSSGTAEFFYVTPGTYYLRLFSDHNENGVWDTGHYDEDLQPEEVYYYPDELECKAKWDVTRTWDPKSLPLYRQKPSKITKQKADKQKTIKNKNAERAKQLGIKEKNKK